MILDLIILLFVFILAALTAGNNLSVSSGPLISGKIIKKNTGILLTILGYASGFLAEGSFLRTGVAQLFPTTSTVLILIVLSISIGIFIIAHKKRVPESLSITFTSALIGVSLAYGSAINLYFISFIIIFWIFASLFSIILSYYLMKRIRVVLENKKIWSSILIMRTLLIIISFLTAFTLGANTIGLIYASIPYVPYSEVVIILGIIFGCIFLSSRELKRISQDIIPIRYLNALVSQSISVLMVESATLFGIPLSNTQTLTSGIYGAGVSYKTRLILKKPAISIVATWILTAIISLVVAYVATLLLVIY